MQGKSSDFQIYRNVAEMPLDVRLSGKVCAYLVSRNSQSVVKKSPDNVKSMGIYLFIFERVLATCSQKYRLAAGSTLKGWHLQVRQFCEKRPLVVAVSHLHLHVPLNNPNILEKKPDNPFKVGRF